jgi:hypothetical protein
MQPYGGDRVRTAGGKIILHSNLSKGWKARVAKTTTNSEFPGTAVFWDEQYFEVIAAELLPQGGVRYVLEPWRDEHTIRVFDHYDEPTEAQRIEDYRRAKAQQKKSLGARLSGIVLGLLPAPVQKHLENELGVTPSTMTMLSCIPSLALLGVCAWLTASAKLDKGPPPVPFLLWLLVFGLVIESAFRFQVAMMQGRGMGTLFGLVGYSLFWLIMPNRRKWPKPFAEERGNRLFTLPPPDDVALRDSLETRGPLLTLLPKSDQLALAERYGFDYRKHAFGLAWIILVSSAFGVVSSWVKVVDSGSVSAFISLVLAGALVIEQIARLNAFKRGPAGSFLAVVVRPFLRGFLERG